MKYILYITNNNQIIGWKYHDLYPFTTTFVANARFNQSRGYLNIMSLNIARSLLKKLKKDNKFKRRKIKIKPYEE